MKKGQAHGPTARFTDIAGMKFGRLTAIRMTGYNHNSKQLWEFVCECGTKTVKVANTVRSDAAKGRIPACGCQQFAGNRRTHGKHGTHEYRVWKGMRQRCNDKNAINYANYGGRGIKVCHRWDDFDSFLPDMGKAPSEKHSIERKDNDKGYEPSNCRWATRPEQSRNKRDNHLVTFNGKTQCLKDWAIELGIRYHTLHSRINRSKWTIEKAFTTR